MPLTIAEQEIETKIRAEGLHFKYDHQLAAMRDPHAAKIPRNAVGLDEAINFPDSIRWPLHIAGELKPAEIEDEVTARQAYCIWKDQRLKEIVFLIENEIDFRARGDVTRNPIGTTYYLDPSTITGNLTGTWTFTQNNATITASGGAATTELAAGDYVKVNAAVQWYKVSSVTNDDTVVLTRTFLESTVTDGAGATDYRDVSVAIGTSTANSYVVLPQFTEVARSAGDILKIRRGLAERISEWASGAFTSDGQINNPIKIEADYDNDWSDQVDLSGTATATLAFGSKAVLWSADVSGLLSANDWIYASGDDNREFAYEVVIVQASDSGTDDGADSNKLIDTGKFTNTVIGTQVVNTTDSITGYVSELVDNDTVEVTLDGRPSGSGGTIVVFDNGDTWTIAHQGVLFLPYKGAQAGSGKTMYNIQAAPLWNTVTGAFQILASGDDYWSIQGVHGRGTNSNGVFELLSSTGWVLKDLIAEGNGGNDRAWMFDNGAALIYMSKCRGYNYTHGFRVRDDSCVAGLVRDCLFDGNSVGSSVGILMGRFTGPALFVDCEFRNHATGDVDFTGESNLARAAIVRFRDCIMSSTTKFNVHEGITSQVSGAFIEDYDGTVGDGRQLTYQSNAEGTPIIQTDTSKSWASGQTKGVKVTPSDRLNSVSELGRVLVWELPFYATTDEKTYTAKFVNDATTDWEGNPTTAEFWIEAEFWGSADFNFRAILKSTGTVDFLGSTSEQSLAVTVTPAQAGVLYLRCYYARVKHVSKSNIFYADPEIAVT